MSSERRGGGGVTKNYTKIRFLRTHIVEKRNFRDAGRKRKIAKKMKKDTKSLKNGKNTDK